ncbi:MAG: hypothetical protein KGY81_05615, partial [Phycisphaerae bacterium]|nr:hypothetical protein [Phycisphaerae bacterium]
GGGLAELAKQREAHRQRASAIDGTEVTISALANVEGHLYGSVGPAQIAAALAEEGHVVEPNEVILDEPIKTLDKYEVTVELAEEITARVNVWVVPDRESAASMAAAAEEVQDAGGEAPDVELSGKVAEIVDEAGDAETAVDAEPRGPEAEEPS